MTQPLDRSVRLPQMGPLDAATGEFWRENVFQMGAGTDNLSAYEPNRMYLNLGGERFLDCSFGSGCDINSDSRSVVAADFDRDGSPDLLVGSVGGGPLRLFANRFSDAHHSVRLNLIGTESNQMGIGSRVIATVGGRKIIRDLFPANGCMGQAPAEMLIGIGTAERIDQLEVRWPNGQTQQFTNLPIDGILSITEGEQDFRFSNHRITSNSHPTSIVTIDDPQWLAATETPLHAGERVLGLKFQGESRAYPIRYMQTHHVCHDDVSGTPLLVSYCAPAAAGTAFERQLVSKNKQLTLSFDVAGMFQAFGYTVLRDRETRSLWNPLTGQCLKGPLRGTRLKAVPLLSTQWAHWRQLNPTTQILASELSAYPAVEPGNSGSQYVQGVSTACSPDDPGLGIRGGTRRLFFPLTELEDGISSGQLGERKIVVFFDPRYAAASCFYASSADGRNEIQFSSQASAPGRFVARDGSVFDVMGRCQAGPHAGQRLRSVSDICVLRWYAWSLTFPGSTVVRNQD